MRAQQLQDAADTVVCAGLGVGLLLVAFVNCTPAQTRAGAKVAGCALPIIMALPPDALDLTPRQGQAILACRKLAAPLEPAPEPEPVDAGRD